MAITRKIIHIDMDAFYASVEQLDNPSIRNKPVAVGSSDLRGVVAAASYEARHFGVRSAMSSKLAKKLCPNLIFAKPRFERYKEFSKIISQVFLSYTDLVETLSLDEAYLDVTENKRGIISATKTARSLGALQERLVAIDKAQANLEKLSGNVLGLQDILSNKQTRGVFGEIQLKDIVSKALPPNSYAFQVLLKNGRRVDCMIYLPYPPGPIAIDSKFPLDAYENLGKFENEIEKNKAIQIFKKSIRFHINSISEKYIVEGETADGAIMFLPSGSNLVIICDTLSKLTVGPSGWPSSPNALLLLINS